MYHELVFFPNKNSVTTEEPTQRDSHMKNKVANITELLPVLDFIGKHIPKNKHHVSTELYHMRIAMGPAKWITYCVK